MVSSKGQAPTATGSAGGTIGAMRRGSTGKASRRPRGSKVRRGAGARTGDLSPQLPDALAVAAASLATVEDPVVAARAVSDLLAALDDPVA